MTPSIRAYSKARYALAGLGMRKTDVTTVGVSVVKNESDIIEWFVRLNLRYLDVLVVMDNGSSDATLSILNRLQAEGLPLVCISDDEPGHFQSRRLTALTRICVETLFPEYITLLDADEFITAESRQALLEELRRDARDAVALIRWKTFVPTPSDDQQVRSALSRIQHRRETERADLGKVIIPSRLISDGEFELLEGSHGLRAPSKHVPHIFLEDARLAHFPVRSTSQLVTKILIGQLSNTLNANLKDGQAFHWKSIYDKVKVDWSTTDSELEQFALEYSDFDSSGYVHDPMLLPGDLECRYDDSTDPDIDKSIASFLFDVLSHYPVYDEAETASKLETLNAVVNGPREEADRASLRAIWTDVESYCVGMRSAPSKEAHRQAGSNTESFGGTR